MAAEEGKMRCVLGRSSWGEGPGGHPPTGHGPASPGKEGGDLLSLRLPCAHLFPFATAPCSALHTNLQKSEVVLSLKIGRFLANQSM